MFFLGLIGGILDITDRNSFEKQALNACKQFLQNRACSISNV
jgi:hypothetical protein